MFPAPHAPQPQRWCQGHVGKSMIRLRREKDRDSNLATANAVIQLAP